MTNAKTFHCWIKIGTGPGARANAQPLRIQPPPASGPLEPDRIQPPPAPPPEDKRIQPPADPGTLAGMSADPPPVQLEDGLAAPPPDPVPWSDAVPRRIQPPAVAPAAARLADMLDENKLKQQPYLLAGYALAGWWNLEAVNAGRADPLGNVPYVELRAVYGTREQALKWIGSKEGQNWLKGASTHFMVSFHSESDA